MVVDWWYGGTSGIGGGAAGSGPRKQQTGTAVGDRASMRGALGQGTQFDARRVRTYETPFR